VVLCGFKDKAPADGNGRAALVKDSKWQKDDEIRICFLDGTDDQKSLVKKFATEWVAPFRFEFLVASRGSEGGRRKLRGRHHVRRDVRRRSIEVRPTAKEVIRPPDDGFDGNAFACRCDSTRSRALSAELRERTNRQS
jgi:hypothetical protein